MGVYLRVATLILVFSIVEAGDMAKKSIIFNKSTPDVFYCPQKKATGVDKMMVSAKPLWKLCEHEGQPLPKGYKSDCYNDVDESDYACKEKKRIMKRLKKEKLEEKNLEKERSSRARRI